MQQYADIYSLQNYSTCFGCHSTNHQEYKKLYPQPPVQVILYSTVRVQFLILLMMGAVTPETCRVVLQCINICILLHLLEFLFTLTYDARNHELKVYFNTISHTQTQPVIATTSKLEVK